MLTKSQVKYIQSLNEKKFRKEEGVFIAEGPKIVGELLSNPDMETVALFATDEWAEAGKEGFNLDDVYFPVTDAELRKISYLSTPNQVLGIFRQPVYSADMSLHGAITLLLDGIQDPGNLGTIIRIADWFGIKHIIAGMDTADVFSPKVVQSTMGSVARVHLRYDHLDNFIGRHPAIPVYAATLQGRPVQEVGKIAEGLLLIGNESKGIQDALIRQAAFRISIPSFGQAESLNAAVATGIILSHIV